MVESRLRARATSFWRCHRKLMGGFNFVNDATMQSMKLIVQFFNYNNYLNTSLCAHQTVMVDDCWRTATPSKDTSSTNWVVTFSCCKLISSELRTDRELNCTTKDEEQIHRIFPIKDRNFCHIAESQSINSLRLVHILS